MVQESVAVAKRFFKDISIPFFDFLETTTFEETHDIADAALFTLMALEETTWYATLVLRFLGVFIQSPHIVSLFL